MAGFFRGQREPVATATEKTCARRVAVSACGSRARVRRSRLTAFSRRNWTHAAKYCDTPSRESVSICRHQGFWYPLKHVVFWEGISSEPVPH
jgi:hypothetical protein